MAIDVFQGNPVMHFSTFTTSYLAEKRLFRQLADDLDPSHGSMSASVDDRRK
jgi:hypothetical protein